MFASLADVLHHPAEVKAETEVKERPQPDETYHAEAVERRFEAALRSALKTSPKPLKDGLAKPAESKRKREAPLKVLAHREAPGLPPSLPGPVGQPRLEGSVVGLVIMEARGGEN